MASALALALLAAGYVLPVLHFTLVAHELCAEHGALHHVEAAKTDLRRAPASKSQAVTLVNAGHEHDDCGLLATTGNRAVLCEGVQVTARLIPVVRSKVSLRARAAERCVALLDYAPKLAPPV